MTIDRIRYVYSNTFFCQIGKWGRSLSEAEAKLLGLPLSTNKDSSKVSSNNKINNKNNKKKNK